MKDELCRMKVNLEARMKKGVSARSDSEFISKVGDCLKEETGYWLELLVDSGTVSSRKIVSQLHETDELLAIFTTASKKTKARVRLHPS